MVRVLSWSLENVQYFCISITVMFTLALGYRTSKGPINGLNWNVQSFTKDLLLLVIWNHTACLVSWGCRIHWLLFCNMCPGYDTNMCPGYDTKQSNGEATVMLELWGMWSTSSMLLLPSPYWPGVVALDGVLYMGQIELNCVLMLKWILWNRTVLTFKVCTYTKLNCLKLNCFCMLNWIVWNQTIFDIETVLKLNWIVWIRTV